MSYGFGLNAPIHGSIGNLPMNLLLFLRSAICSSYLVVLISIAFTLLIQTDAESGRTVIPDPSPPELDEPD